MLFKVVRITQEPRCTLALYTNYYKEIGQEAPAIDRTRFVKSISDLTANIYLREGISADTLVMTS
jgi:hypothetical protein